MIEITINNFLNNISYSQNYFCQILRDYNISNRYILNEDDLRKLLEVPVTTQKSYELRVYLYKLLDMNVILH